MVIDHSYLSCEHHLAMVAGIGMVTSPANILLIGLGGGLLATYINKYFPEVSRMLHIVFGYEITNLLFNIACIFGMN